MASTEFFRKIIVGPDPKTGMKYLVGQSFPIGKIEVIKRVNYETSIIVRNLSGELQRWKHWNNAVPIHFEDDLNFAESN
jgi:hypothetical protein